MSAITTPFFPRVEFNKRFAPAITAAVGPLSAYVFGPAADVVRFDDPTMQSRGRLGAYNEIGVMGDNGFETGYAWPNLAVGGMIDVDYTRLYVKNAYLRYYQSQLAAMFVSGLNTITHTSHAFISNTGFPAHATLGDRKARIGDRVRVEGEVGGDAFSLDTYIRGFAGVKSTATVDPVQAVAQNKATVAVRVETVTPGVAVTSDIILTTDFSAYNGFPSGRLSETYLVEVIQASTAMDLTTAKLRVTSASGLDNSPIVSIPSSGLITIGTRGAVIEFTNPNPNPDNLVIGDSWTIVHSQAYTVPVLTVTGTYAANDEQDRTYLIEMIAGARAADGPVVRISTTQGGDVAQTVALVHVSAGLMRPILLGSYGLTLTLQGVVTGYLAPGFVTGDKWLVKAIAAKQTSMTTLVLAHNLPSGVLQGSANAAAAALEVSLFINGEIEIPHRSATAGVYNFISTSTELLVKAGITVEHPEWTISGIKRALPLVTPVGQSVASILHATYRAWLPESAIELSIRSGDELNTTVLGPLHPDNPLKYALSKALLTNGGFPIYLFQVGNPDSLTGWGNALSAVIDNRQTYGFVPLTRNAAVLELVAGYVDSLSRAEFNLWRVAWLTGDMVSEISVLNSDLTSNDQLALATIIDNPGQSGVQNTLVVFTSSNVSLIEMGVRAGDRIRYAFATDAWGDVTFSEYTITEVINESSVRLVSGPANAETVPRRCEIQRTLTPAEQIDVIKTGVRPFTADPETVDATGEARFTGYLIRYLPFANVEDGSRVVPSYHMAAMLAALRSSLAPHQPLTRFPVPGFSTVNSLRKFTSSQLNELASSGCFLVERNTADGSLVVRHGVTAGDWNNVNQREESIISNVDSMNAYMLTVLDPYIGQALAVDAVIAAMRAEVTAAGDFLRTANATNFLGGQLVELIINAIRPTPLAADAVIIDIEYVVGSPINRIPVSLLIRQ